MEQEGIGIYAYVGRPRKSPRSCAQFGVAGTLTVLVLGLLVGASGDQRVASARQVVEAFLRDPAAPKCNVSEVVLASEGDSITFALTGGRWPGDKAVVNTRAGCVSSFSFRASEPGTCDLLTPDQAETIAVGVCRRQCPAIWVAGDRVTVIRTGTVDQEGCYLVRLCARKGSMWLPESCEIWLRGRDGKVAILSTNACGANYQLPSVTVSEAQAGQLAIEAAHRGGHPAAEVVLAQLGGHSEEGGCVRWLVRLSTAGPSAPRDVEPGLAVWIDAHTGIVQKVEDRPIRADFRRRAKEWAALEGNSYTIAEDRFRVDEARPSWASDTRVVFQGCRSLPGGPLWAGAYRAIYAVEIGGGGLTCLVGGGRHDFTEPRVSGRTLVATYHPTSAIVVDMVTGDFRFIGSESRPAFQASLSPDCASVVFAGDRRNGDCDVFQCSFSVTAGLVTIGDHLRLARRKGIDCQPLFSADGKTVYFAGEELGSDNTLPDREYGVYRVAAGRSYEHNAAPEFVVGGFGAVGRITQFPDGRLLVWHGKGLDVVDVAARSKRSLQLGELRDPDIPNCPALEWQDPAVSPDGKRIALSVHRVPQDPTKGTGWYIYVCNLDGSGLRRVTPLEDRPIELYKYPQSGMTAAQVAKRIADADLKRSEAVER